MIIPAAVKKVRNYMVTIGGGADRVEIADVDPYAEGKTVFNYLGMNLLGEGAESPMYANLVVSLWPYVVVDGVSSSVSVRLMGDASANPSVNAEIHFQVIEFN